MTPDAPRPTDPAETPRARDTPATSDAQRLTDPPTGTSESGAAWTRYLPGLALCAVAVLVAMVVNAWLPPLSPLLVAILLGALVANLWRLPASTAPGTTFASKKLLRLGVVLLGLQVMLGDIAGLGWGMIGVVVAVVLVGIGSTLLVGRLLGVGAGLRLLVACGFSICGAAAVAAVDGVVDAEDEDVATAVALVVLFGTLMIPVVPLLVRLMGMDAHTAGLWAGGSIHEVAQVVAAGGAIGGGALTVAVIVKLARVLMLAPVMATISWQRRRHLASQGSGGTLPPLVPLFVLGFVAMVLLRSFGHLPGSVLSPVKTLQTVLLSAAMFALGCGVQVRTIAKVGATPFVLALVSTLVVAGTALAGVLLVS